MNHLTRDNNNSKGQKLEELTCEYIAKYAHRFSDQTLRKLPSYLFDRILDHTSASNLNQFEENGSCKLEDTNIFWYRLFRLRWVTQRLSKDGSFKQLYWQRHVLDCLTNVLEKYYYAFESNNDAVNIMQKEIDENILLACAKTPNQFMKWESTEDFKLQSNPDEPRTISQIFKKYGSYVHEMKLSNAVFHVSIDILRVISHSLLSLTRVEFHGMKDESIDSVSAFVLECSNIESISILHSFLSEKALNQFLFTLVHQSIQSHGPSVSLLSSKLYKPSITSVPLNTAWDKQDKTFDIYEDLFLEDIEQIPENILKRTRDIAGIYDEREGKNSKSIHGNILHRLKSLSFLSTVIYESSCELLGEILRHTSNLQTFECSFNRINSKMAELIFYGISHPLGNSQISRLLTLRVSENDIGDSILDSVICPGLSPDSFFSKLTTLDISYNHLTGRKLFSHLRENAYIELENINLYSNELSNDTVNELCDFLKDSRLGRRPLSLKLSKCQLKPHHMTQIFHSLSFSEHIKSISMSNNDAYGQSHTIGCCLLRNIKLQKLNIGHVSLSEINTTLEEALLTTETLQSLRIYGNKLTDAVAPILARVIKSRTKHRKLIRKDEKMFHCFDLDISANRLTDHSASLFMEALSMSHQSPAAGIIHKLDVSMNFFSKDTVNTWRKLAQMQHIELSITNFIGEERYFEPCDGVTAT